jgi:protocatechuate 3,4-dioxygenase alpha subunit
MPIASSSQTIGPYWHLLRDDTWADLTRFGATGDIIEITGRITDGGGQLVTDACVEIWQSSPPQSATFEGFGRAATNEHGAFTFKTLRPGPEPGVHGPSGNSQQAPHVALTILARGLTKALTTRIYFEGDPGQDTDPVLSLIENPARRATLIAHQTQPSVWTLDIRLQGNNETVFLEI